MQSRVVYEVKRLLARSLWLARPSSFLLSSVMKAAPKDTLDTGQTLSQRSHVEQPAILWRTTASTIAAVPATTAARTGNGMAEKTYAPSGSTIQQPA